MKQLSNKLILALLMSIAGITASVHAQDRYDIAVNNADGVTIYYHYINESTELEVCLRGYTYYGGNSYNYYTSYSGNVVIPEEVTFMNRIRKVTSIGYRAFYNCSDLTSVNIPNSVMSIGNYAFSGCSKLTSITIPSGVTNIGSNVFSNCSKLTSITIPSGVTSIGDKAFYGCTSLTSVTIPNNVMSIGDDAFYNCSKLTSITIPSGATRIGDYAFYGCYNLKKVIVSDIAAWCGIYFVGNYNSNPLAYAHHIYSDENTEITHLFIPNSVTKIGGYTFYNCSDLTSVNIPNSVTSIGDKAFYGCTSLTSVTIGSGVASIGQSAFAGQDIPTIISLIENPTAIAGKTASYPTFSKNTFNNATLYVPKGTIDKYKATSGWKDFLFIEEGTPTAVQAVKQDATAEGPATIYNIKGELQNAPLNALPHGIYIVNDKKVIK